MGPIFSLPAAVAKKAALNLQLAEYIIFFDSTGDAPPKEITKFVKKIIKQGKALGLHFKYVVNTKEHQKRNTECGMYSLFMIINLLKETRTPEDFLTTLFTDKEMERFRSIFFNHEEV
jgi:hypothetical protein